MKYLRIASMKFFLSGTHPYLADEKYFYVFPKLQHNIFDHIFCIVGRRRVHLRNVWFPYNLSLCNEKSHQKTHRGKIYLRCSRWVYSTDMHNHRIYERIHIVILISGPLKRRTTYMLPYISWLYVAVISSGGWGKVGVTHSKNIRITKSDIVQHNVGKYSIFFLDIEVFAERWFYNKSISHVENKVKSYRDIRNLLLQGVDFKQLGEIAYSIRKNWNIRQFKIMYVRNAIKSSTIRYVL